MVGLNFLASTCSKVAKSTDFLLPDLYKGLHDASGGLCITGLNDVKTLLINVLQIILALSGLVAVGMVMFAGFTYITSNGNAPQITKAKDTLINWVIGLIIIIGAYAIVGLVAGAVH